MEGHFQNDLNIFDELQKRIDTKDCTKEQLSTLRKFMELFLVGQLVGLPTLNAILTRYGIISNNHQKKYKSIHKNLSNKILIKIFEFIFENHLSTELQEMLKKDESIWSKKLVTVIIDDSIFRQWLKNFKDVKSFEDCYDKFFSGQFKAPVYGQKVVTLGLSINGILYPLYFGLAKKGKKSGATKAEIATGVAIKLVKKWREFLEKHNLTKLLEKELHFSCDNGYSDLELEQTCQTNGLIYISVPKKSHIILIRNKKHNISNYIEEHYLVAEQEHLEMEKHLSKDEKTPFTMRVRATYQAFENKEVVLLFFRLDGSKNVSCIYSTKINIFAKTLRHHWFQRTYIEQFFRLLKHTLQIAQVITGSRNDFELKIFRFFFIALHAQKLVAFFRKRQPKYRHVGFQVIQRQLVCDNFFFDLLQKLIA